MKLYGEDSFMIALIPSNNNYFTLRNSSDMKSFGPGPEVEQCCYSIVYGHTHRYLFEFSSRPMSL